MRPKDEFDFIRLLSSLYYTIKLLYCKTCLLVQSLPYIAFRPHSTYIPYSAFTCTSSLPHSTDVPEALHLCTSSNLKMQDLRESFNDQTPYVAARFLLLLFWSIFQAISKPQPCAANTPQNELVCQSIT